MTTIYAFEAETRGVIVRVTPRFLAAESDPAAGRFFWSYTVEVENTSDITVQLVARFWRITDNRGRTQEVRGPGVVGEQPILPPGEAFTYTSGCPLEVASGMMQGTYTMVTEAGARFEAEIPPFSLDSPFDRPSIN